MSEAKLSQLAYLGQTVEILTVENKALRADKNLLLQLLEEALEGYEDCISYKSEYLVEKHGDKEEIARIRKAMGESDG